MALLADHGPGEYVEGLQSPLAGTKRIAFSLALGD